MTSRKKQVAKAKKVQARAAKAAGAKAPANGKSTVQSLLHQLFSQTELPEASVIIATVAKATGRAPLSVATLKLYRERFNSGKLGLQKGIKPTRPCPVLKAAATK